MSDYRTTRGEPAPLPRDERRRQRWNVFACVFLALLALLTASATIQVDRYAPATGYVTWEEYAEVRPPERGVVAEILVDSGQKARAGDILARLNNAAVQAPISGEAIRYEFAVGESVSPDMVLYEIFGGGKQILTLRVDEQYATLVAPGQPYRAELLAYSGSRHVRFEGRVEKMRNVIQAENRKTYRIAHCSFDAMGYEAPAGSTAEARIRVGRSPFWKSLFGIF